MTSTLTTAPARPSVALRAALHTVTRIAVYAVPAIAVIASHSRMGDFPLFSYVSKRMFGSEGLSVYANHPNIQSGPLSLTVIRLLSFRWTSGTLPVSIVFAALAVLTVWLLRRIRSDRDAGAVDRADGALLVGSLLIGVWWTSLRAFGHLDDALVIVVFLTCLLLIERDRRTRAAILIGLALAIKPWSIFLLPLTAVRGGRRRDLVRGPLISLAVGGMLWTPFVLWNRKTLDSLRPTVQMAPDSVLRIFHLTSSADVPSWIRLVQLTGAIVVAAIAMYRNRPLAVMLGGVAARVAVDPGTWGYYTAGFVVGALVWDLCVSRRRFPVAAIAASVLLAPAWAMPHPMVRAWARLLCCVVAMGIATWPERRADIDVSVSDASVPEPVAV